jgi:HAD superfamily hydrolase (TIGR01450 family)
MFELKKKKAFVCDLDGTLFMGGEPIGPAVDFVIKSTLSGRFSFYFLTNNTSKTPEEYMKKIAGAVIPVKPEQILTPLITLEAYIREKGYKSVYLLAGERVTAHMAERLADAGVSFEYNPEKNELIALAYDKDLTYAKLADATALWNMRNVPPSPMCPVRTANQTPVDFVATHPDNCCPSERGPIPDVGGIMKFLEITNGMKPSHVFGKPSPSLLKTVLERFSPEEIAVVGDRLYTDKAIADNAGVDFVCVLSGETTPGDLAEYKGTPPAITVDTFDMIDDKQ